MDHSKPMRHEAYGQSGPLSWVDKFGCFLSRRRIRKHINRLKKDSIKLLDVGCGYHAKNLLELTPDISTGTGIDIAISAIAKSTPKLTFMEQPIEKSLAHFPDASFDVILMISVLEHLNDPQACLNECRRVLTTDGVLLINVPTWKGKSFLELSAFQFKLSPAMEMDDHKMYYDQKDLWPLLVKANFKPSAINIAYYKFGMNLFAVCQKT